jgi:Trk K+ transport system NAD-binding subunit
VPHGRTFLKTGDILTVFGTDTALSEMRELMKYGTGIQSNAR